MNMHISIGMHNLDAIHGDEHLGDELRDDQIDLVSEDFWEGKAEIFGNCTDVEFLALEISADPTASKLLFQLCATNPAMRNQQPHILELLQRLTVRVESLIRNQIREGNIRSYRLSDD